MSLFVSRAILLAVAGFICFPPLASAQSLDQIGVTALRAVTNLNGAGISVGQAEAGEGTVTNWQVNPAVVGQPASLFTWISGSSPYLLPPSTSGVFPNSLGSDSGHANQVGSNFFGIVFGVATNVVHVNNYEANTFVNYYVNGDHAISERIVNQSFTFGTNDAGINQIYDDYAAQHGVLFVSGAGFSGQPVWSPATCYNGIGAGVFNDPNSPYGPTIDGRSKPDITVSGYPAGLTSFSTPYVSGAAALLMQAALRGDGGGDTNSAADIRTLKALLLNGAVKPVSWTNSLSAPLHSRYGAGVLNVLNSWKQLAGGKHTNIAVTTVSLNASHPPNGAAGTVSVLSGWDLGTNTSGKTGQQYDAVNHYYFNVSNNVVSARFIATATLVWNRQAGKTAINNLDLFLYNCANSNLVLCSTSLVDNVEHLYITNLAQGRYDLQVWKAGGSGIISAAEPYALAWQFVPPPSLALAKSGTNVNLTWPLYPAGFRVEARSNLLTGAWSTNSLPPSSISNVQNTVLLKATNATQFFRLRQLP